VIADASLAAGHDGRAEIQLELAYPNGGRTRISVSQETLTAILDRAGVSGLDELCGQSWTVLVEPARHATAEPLIEHPSRNSEEHPCST
jgi:hypothetical protein